ncbi:nuclear transport factor 2 family protein [Streptomyces sp. NPDC001530]|uniref:nuclear transport factor 2 family protein n=1 Tax=Streptomyces sp. NPDC001530 TaxID=3364582 RepID=UPI0036A58952
MPDTPSAELSPRQVLEAYHQAIVEADADAVADLYAVDAVHEFPFLFPGVTDYHGREEVRAGYRAAWEQSPARTEKVVEVAVHAGKDPELLIAERFFEGTISTTGQTFLVPSILVLRVRGGQIVHARDYMDGLGTAKAMGALEYVVSALGANAQ